MELDEAYRILEVEVGATEDVVREARKTLAKVWHPDRHASDPQLQARAQTKLADVNAAFEVVSKAGFPPKPAAKPSTPPPAAPPPTAPAPPPPTAANIEFVPQRRVRWPVIFVLAAALGVGAYFAIVKLGGERKVIADEAKPTADATVVVVADAAEPREVDATTAIVRREKTFTLGSTRDDVIAAQGQPNGTHTKSTTINGVRTASARLTYGESSTIDLDADDKVTGWAENDTTLHVRLDVRDGDLAAKAKARGMFSVGASADEVLGVLGPPMTLAGDRWTYGTSTIDFAGGKVAKVMQGEPKLPLAP